MKGVVLVAAVVIIASALVALLVGTGIGTGARGPAPLAPATEMGVKGGGGLPAGTPAAPSPVPAGPPRPILSGADAPRGGTAAAAPATAAGVPATPFIRLDPVGERNTRDQIIVTGTTSLRPGTAIFLKYGSVGRGSADGGIDPDAVIRSSSVIIPGKDGQGRIGIPMVLALTAPGDYQLYVTDRVGTVSGSAWLSLKGEDLRAQEEVFYDPAKKTGTISGTGVPFIQANVPAEMHSQEPSFFTGTTNLVEGTVINAWFDCHCNAGNRSTPCPADPAIPGMASNSYIYRGTGTTNQYAIPFHPGSLAGKGPLDCDVKIFAPNGTAWIPGDLTAAYGVRLL